VYREAKCFASDLEMILIEAVSFRGVFVLSRWWCIGCLQPSLLAFVEGDIWLILPVQYACLKD